MRARARAQSKAGATGEAQLAAGNPAHMGPDALGSGTDIDEETLRMMIFMLEKAPRVGERQTYRLFEPRYRVMLAQHFEQGTPIAISSLPMMSSYLPHTVLTA